MFCTNLNNILSSIADKHVSIVIVFSQCEYRCVVCLVFMAWWITVLGGPPCHKISAVPCLRLLVAGLSPRRPGFDPM